MAKPTDGQQHSAQPKVAIRKQEKPEHAAFARRSTRSKPRALTIGEQVRASGTRGGVAVTFVGHIIAAHASGTFDVAFEDGEIVHSMPASHLKLDELEGTTARRGVGAALSPAPQKRKEAEEGAAAPSAKKRARGSDSPEAGGAPPPTRPTARAAPPPVRRSLRDCAGHGPERLGETDDWGLVAASAWYGSWPTSTSAARPRTARRPLALLKDGRGRQRASANVATPRAAERVDKHAVMATPDAAILLLALARVG